MYFSYTLPASQKFQDQCPRDASLSLSLSLMNGVIHQLQINHHEKIIKGNQSQSRIPPSLDSSPDRLRVISYLPIFCPHRARDKLSLAQVENHPIFTTEKTT